MSPTSRDSFDISIPEAFCHAACLASLAADKDKENADGSIFCVCCANLCVTNPSGTSGRGCDKNSRSLNLLKRKKFQMWQIREAAIVNYHDTQLICN